MQNDVTIAIGWMKFVVSDIDGMTMFYEQVFGFEVEKRIKFGEATEIMLRLPGSEVGLVLVHHGDRAITAGTSYGPLVIETNNVKALTDAAVAAGATVTLGPVELPNLSVAMVDDPEGHTLEFLHLPTGEFDFNSLKPEDLRPSPG